MPKAITERIIDYPQSAAGRASQYSAGATPGAAVLADHTHDGTANSGAPLALYAPLNSPVLVTPILGAASATSLAVPAITAPGTLTVTPAAGNDVAIALSGAGKFFISGASLPVLKVERTSAVANAQRFGLAFFHTTTADMTDGFGAGMGFYIKDSSGVENPIASVVAIRDGGDNEGALALQAGTNGAEDFVRILASGKVGLMTILPTHDLSLGGNFARTIWMERRTAVNTPGQPLTVQAGGATASATDKAGGDLNLLPGITTGTGRSNVRLGRYGRGTTGTADNAAADGLIVAGAVNLTDAATSIFEIALAAGASAGGCIIWTIRASDGTDMQAYTGVTTFSAVNKAGTYTTTVTTNANNDAKAVSAGTLTAAFTLLNGTSKVTMQITPAGSLTETTYQMLYTLFNNSPQAIIIL